MTVEPSERPISEEVDLRDFRWMKLDIVRVLNSDFNAMADDTAWRCGVTLWMKAWHQVPAGSLPDDDATLCHLAGLGRDLKTWKRIKPLALHGFYLFDDGRLYHPVICEQAKEAWIELQEHRQRREADRIRKAEARKGKNSGSSNGCPPDELPLSGGHGGNVQRTAPENPQEKALRGRGREDKKEEEGKPSSKKSDPDPQKRGTRIPEGMTLPPEWDAFARAEGHPAPEREWLKFTDYWRAQPGQKGVKLDWEATWRNWIRKAVEDGSGTRSGTPNRPRNGFAEIITSGELG